MLLSLGSFIFSIDTAAYNALAQSAEYPWAKVERLGGSPQFQAMGKEHRKINLSGVVFPTYDNVGAEQIELLRTLAGQMEPQILVGGDGRILGKWCVTNISEDDSCFFEQGTPRKQAFSLEMERYSDD